ncbi:hypothetical protein MEO93_20910 [Dolichospermum sp. ST_sed3]|nr:hypothetical protein [Dolichospermum sp. ST_sed3]
MRNDLKFDGMNDYIEFVPMKVKIQIDDEVIELFDSGTQFMLHIDKDYPLTIITKNKRKIKLFIE